MFKSYHPLYAIGWPAELRQVFVQVVRGHYVAYKTSKVLHCDISVNNIVWFRRGGEVIGVLCDWDLAEDQENCERRAGAVNIGPDASVPSRKGEGNTLPLRQSQRISGRPSHQQNVESPAATSENNAKPRYRTGTGPFMAVELLLSNPPLAHKYRYDLESFFYVYVCGAATYRPDGDQKIFVIKDWVHESLETIGDKMVKFFGNAEQYDKVFEGAHADFKPAIDGFLYDMWLVFKVVARLSDDISMITATGRRLPTPEDEKMIANKKQEQDDRVTYQAFMRILGEPELLAEASESRSA